MAQRSNIRDRQVVAGNIRTLRQEAGLSQLTAAGRAEVDQTTWSKWERGISMPCADMVPTLAEVLGGAPADLFRPEVNTP